MTIHSDRHAVIRVRNHATESSRRTAGGHLYRSGRAWASIPESQREDSVLDSSHQNLRSQRSIRNEVARLRRGASVA